MLLLQTPVDYGDPNFPSAIICQLLLEQYQYWSGDKYVEENLKKIKEVCGPFERLLEAKKTRISINVVTDESEEIGGGTETNNQLYEKLRGQIVERERVSNYHNG